MLFMDWTFIAYSIYVPFLIFIYILENAAIFKHRNNIFSSSFYKIFMVLSTVNIFACLVGSFISRLNLYPIVNSFYAGLMEFSPWLNLAYFATYYLNCFSEFLGLFMAFSLFTALYFPLTHNKIWERGFYIGVFICLTVSIAPVWNLLDDTDMYQKASLDCFLYLFFLL
ncbi:hypothetical protein PFISCL1PPCAC_14492 [Pristionchus fissidentatus]|uniref:Serpentine receptor class gamma n=1 Tax=Pristionchus fissidentatus TaxID=1538716 RepID=A0AAV5VUK2_9BILA|nr:hypothetical protein PFISCL1PPCAC_14492 [Pristionchus fissidentatus]